MQEKMSSLQIFLRVGILCLASAVPSGIAQRPVPSDDLLKWSSLEVGALVSWNMATMVNTQGCASGMQEVPPTSNFGLAENTSIATWAETLKLFGAKYAVLVAKHNCGFTLWPTRAGLPAKGFVYNYSIENSPLKGRDLVKEFVTTMRQYDIQPGIYYSLGNNFYLNVLNRQRAGNPKPGQVQLSMSDYYEVVQQQLKELWTGYGQLAEIWFDGGAPDEVKAPLKVLFGQTQSHAVAFQVRTSGQEGRKSE